MKRPLPILRSGAGRLEIPTILDRSLAELHGSPYVLLCAFAIDLDRVYVLDPDAEHLAFGWEVFLTECYALAALDPKLAEQHSLLEDTCLSILEQSPDDQGYGSQLSFAVYDAIERGYFPTSLLPTFRSWRARPKQLRKALDALFQAGRQELCDHAAYCLSGPIGARLDPPLAPTTRAALERMSANDWPLPAAPQP